MSTRRAKQIVYGMFYILLWAIFAAVVWFAVTLVAPAAPVVVPCTVSTCAPTGTAPLAVSPVQTFLSSPGHYTFLVQVQNTDPAYAASYFDYAVNLRDASGTVLQSFPGSSFIYAGQSKYLVVPNAAVGEPFVSADLTIADAYWAATPSLGSIPSFAYENMAAGSTSSTVSVSGELTNANLSATRYVFVDVIFLDGSGNPVGASQTELNNVAPNQTVNFSVAYPQTQAGSIDPAKSSVFIYGLK